MFSIHPSPNRMHMRLPATLDHIDRADEELGRFLTGLKRPIDLFAVRILLREALLNAITHGCGQNPDLEVDVTIEVDEAGVVLTVCDPGPGFAWADRPLQFDIAGDGGRGLPIMHTYASNVRYNTVGNEVCLRREFDPASAAV